MRSSASKALSHSRNARLLSRMRKAATTTKPKQQAKTTMIPTTSKGENVLGIQDLTSQVKELGESSACWNNLVFGLVALTAVVALAYGIVVMVANRKGQQLQKAQAVLIRAKDEHLARDLKERDLRIAEATSTAAQANERAQLLERENLTLRSDFARIEKVAADAKATQQRVEIELAKQREQTAIAQRALLELQERVKPRSISRKQRVRLIETLKHTPKGPVQVAYVHGVSSVEGGREAVSFAKEIRDVLTACGWPPGAVDARLDPGSTLAGVEIHVRDAKAPPPHAADLQRAFGLIGIPLRGVEDAAVPQETVSIVVGGKP